MLAATALAATVLVATVLVATGAWTGTPHRAVNVVATAAPLRPIRAGLSAGPQALPTLAKRDLIKNIEGAINSSKTWALPPVRGNV